MSAIRITGVAVLFTGLLIGPATLASAGAQVTRGDFAPLDIPDYPVSGHATMVRTGSGETKVSVEVSGLEPGATYASHVHNRACSDMRGGGHYMNDTAGPATPPNELWLSSDPKNPSAGLSANPAGNANGHGTAPWTARPEARSVVIHQTGNLAVRIACADLS